MSTVTELVDIRELKDDKRIAEVALKAFFKIAEGWGLTRTQQAKVLGSGESTIFKWKQTPPTRLSPDTVERISYILGIYKALQILFPEPKRANQWVRKPNQAPLFNGQSALERMLSGNVSDLYEVRRYLEGQRGVW